MMASTSSSSKSNFGVFLSFRGEDTRGDFTSHLYAALSRKHVSIFIDDKLKRGQEISPQLLKTIEESKVSVIIFSENYADSRWCLDELGEIMDCKEAEGQIVLPIFYHVDPSDVRKQVGNFGEAFGIVKEKFKSNSVRIQRWSTALTKAADLSGWNSNNYSNEYELCEAVACHVKDLCPPTFTASSDFVGVSPIVEKIKLDLCIGAPGVRSIGILGIGGIGKTTIAELVFAEISGQFDFCCFFCDVRKKLEDFDKVEVKRRFYSQLLRVDTSNIQAVHLLPMEIKEELNRRKVVVVLDDVSRSDQLDGFGVSEDWLGQGSRIIITSRDKQVLKNCYVDQIYPMEGLGDMDAMELLKMKAFRKMDPEEGHTWLIKRVVDYCKGVPLALKVLGSHLCQRTPKQWEIELDTLGKHPKPEIIDILKISYDSLTSKEKSICLDVACYFEGWDKDRVIPIFDSCGFPSEQGLMRLEDKCLITTKHNMLRMHDLIKEMGRHIAQEQGSRLWDSKDISRLLTSNKENEVVEIIDFNPNGTEKVQLHQEALVGMSKLRILRFHGGKEQNIELIQQSDQPNLVPLLPHNLSLLHWEYYPFKSLPSRTFRKNLVELIISRSNITQLWDGNQCPENLKLLDLSFCRKLISLPNLSLATKLIKVNLGYCENLRSLPSMIKLKSLKILDLSGCSSVKILPDIPGGIEVLKLHRIGVEEWPLSICYLKNLHSFSMSNCINITQIPSNIVMNFNVVERVEDDGRAGCENLRSVPMIKGNVRNIVLSGTGIQELPCLDGLSSLEHLNLANSSKLVKLHSLDGLSSLKTLLLCNCSSLVTLPPLDGLSSLLVLNLDGCSSLVTLPRLKDLRSLEELSLNGWSSLLRLPPLDSLSSLKLLSLDNCSNLIILPHLDSLSSLKSLWLNGCSNLVTLPPLDGLRSLRELSLRGCSKLVMLPPLNGLSRLKEVKLDETALSEIPNDTASLSSLKFLMLRNCKRLKCLPKLPNQLRHLNVAGCTCLTTVASTSYIPYPGSIWYAGWEFNYINCVNLDQEDRSTIMAGAQSLVKKLAVTNKELGHQLNYRLAIPGSEIPEWVMHQSRGSSISIDFPPNCFDTENLLGFAFFVVLECNENNLWRVCLCVNCPSRKYYYSSDFGWDVLQSDHLFVWYNGEVVDGNLGRVFEFSVRAFEFIPGTGKLSFGTKIKVKKCGVDLIYYDKRSTEVFSYCLEEPTTTESESSESEVDCVENMEEMPQLVADSVENMEEMPQLVADSIENMEETVQLEVDSEETPNSKGMKDFFSKLCSCFEVFT